MLMTGTLLCQPISAILMTGLVGARVQDAENAAVITMTTASNRTKHALKPFSLTTSDPFELLLAFWLSKDTNQLCSGSLSYFSFYNGNNLKITICGTFCVINRDRDEVYTRLVWSNVGDLGTSKSV